MLFHEIYSTYYNAVSKLLALAVSGELTNEKLYSIVKENAFLESSHTIMPKLKNQEWQLLNKDNTTPLKHPPTLPLTMLEKRWLKALCLDPRIQLFDVDIKGLEEIEPLFTLNDYVVFDRCNDGDPFVEDDYIDCFQLILKAIKGKKRIKVTYLNRNGQKIQVTGNPEKLEYSRKDDKFRLMIVSRKRRSFLNLSRIQYCELLEEINYEQTIKYEKRNHFFILELLDERNALERVMLHFAHFKKEAEKITNNQYKVKIFYDSEDETELLIRVLSFGPLVKVIEPNHFVELIKERLMIQQSWELK